MRELISSEDPAYDPQGQEVQFIVKGLGANPFTGDVECCGHNIQDNIHFADFEYGLYYARRSHSGEWSQELVCGLDHPALASWDAEPSQTHLAWQANGEPVIVFNAYKSEFLNSLTKVYVAERQPGGGWNVKLWFDGAGYSASTHALRLLGPGRFMSLGSVDLGDPSAIYLLEYDNGPLPPEDTGMVYDYTAANSTNARDIYLNAAGMKCILFTRRASVDAWGVNVLRRLGAGEWEEERPMECTLYPPDTYYLGVRRAFLQSDGSLRLICEPGKIEDNSAYLVGYTTGSTELTLQVLHEGYSLQEEQTNQTELGISIFSRSFKDSIYIVKHEIISDTGIVTELIQDNGHNPTFDVWLLAAGAGPDARQYASLTVQGGSYPGEHQLVFLCTRVDLRIGP